MLRSAPYVQGLWSLDRSRGPLWTTGRTSLLPALLIVALLLCHGVLGFAHEMSCGTCGPGEVQAAHQEHVPQTEGDAGDGQASGLAGTAYAAVVISVLGAAILGLLGMARRQPETFSSRISERRLLPMVPRPPREPTLASLQAFRL